MVWTRALRTCFVCGKHFPAKANAVYCSPSCKQVAYRIRQLVAAGKKVVFRGKGYSRFFEAAKKGGNP
jgi:predicted nucleic acid-binding Zn ribbon protein